MKITIFFYIALCLTYAIDLAQADLTWADDGITQEMVDAMLDGEAIIPLQAATCDIAGIGRVSTYTNQPNVVTIESLWYGDYTNEVIELSSKCEESLPTNSCFFFVSRAAEVAFPDPPEYRYSYIFTLADIRDKVITNSCYFEMPEDIRRMVKTPPITFITNTGFYLMNDIRSLIPVNPTNMPMITWASNLIVAAQVETNRARFCNLLVEGYIATNVPKRMKSDVLETFWHTHIFLTSNEIFNMYMNTNLDRSAKSELNYSYNRLTGSFITN